jgi:hypothetical protein
MNDGFVRYDICTPVTKREIFLGPSDSTGESIAMFSTKNNMVSGNWHSREGLNYLPASERVTVK